MAKINRKPGKSRGDFQEIPESPPPPPKRPRRKKKKFKRFTQHGADLERLIVVYPDVNLEVFNLGLLIGQALGTGNLEKQGIRPILRDIELGVYEGLAKYVGRDPRAIAALLGTTPVRLANRGYRQRLVPPRDHHHSPDL